MAEALAEAVAAACGLSLKAASLRPVGGGSINTAARLESDAGPVFLKTNRPDGFEMFAAEAEGLAELAAAGAVRVPRVFGAGVDAGRAWLLLEYLELGPADAACRRRLGTGLAALHRHTAERHGWHRDNTIGSTPQPNGPDDDWVRFLAEKRIGFQLDLAGRNGHGRTLAADGEALLARLGDFFRDYTPVPSLLHGDLWGGNAAFAGDGAPVIYDPATYYGDRETDLAMAELFGGFPAPFHEGYDAVWPREAGYRTRRELYQLYHVLNHFNLFGGMYRSSAQRLIDGLLAELG